MVFLGSDLLSSLCEQTLSREQMASNLADYMHYPDFNGDFPGICDYKDYFTFTQYQDKLIPSYVVKQLRNRGFWLLGYYPKSWDRRLIMKIILRKRTHEEPALTVFQQTDEFASLYLKNKQIENYPIDLKIFVEKLQAQL